MKSSVLPSTFRVLGTVACNLGCTYCYCYKGTSVEKGDVSNFQRVLSGLEGWLEECLNPRIVILLGGEPLLLPKEVLGKISEMSRQHGAKVVLQSNGTLEEAAVWAQKRGIQVNLSIDGDEDSHDRHRTDCRGNGTYKTAIRTLETLQSAGGNPAVIATLIDQSALKTLRHLQGLGVQNVTLRLADPEGPDQLKNEESERRYRCFLSELERILEEWDPHAHADALPNPMRMFCEIIQNRAQRPCAPTNLRLQPTLGINWRGEAIPCARRLQEVIGYPWKESWRDIFERQKKQQDFNWVPASCWKCRFLDGCFAICPGGLIRWAEAERRNINPRCPKELLTAIERRVLG